MRNTACRFCRHLVNDHNLIHGCPHCTCAGTPGEARPRTDAEDMAPISPLATYGHHELRRPPEPPKPDPELLALAAAVRTAADMLDQEDHRYVERFQSCPNGCEYDNADPPKQTAGPEVCDADDGNGCWFGTIENEDAPWVDPLIARLRKAAAAIVPDPAYDAKVAERAAYIASLREQHTDARNG
jgi:hypothetical protein